MAVFPTPGSPIATGLFLVLRDSTWMARSSLRSWPITGSSFPSWAECKRAKKDFLQSWCTYRLCESDQRMYPSHRCFAHSAGNPSTGGTGYMGFTPKHQGEASGPFSAASRNTQDIYTRHNMSIKNMDKSPQASRVREHYRPKVTMMESSKSEKFLLSPNNMRPAGMPGRNQYIPPNSASSPNFRGSAHNMLAHPNFEIHRAMGSSAPRNLTQQQTNTLVHSTWKAAGRFDGSGAGRNLARIVAPADSRTLVRPEIMPPAGTRGVGSASHSFSDIQQRPGAGGF
jgi:hypothetical protein